MRSQRDTSMSDMSQLKTRIKEQNSKLLQLTQERAKWDAKAKAGGTMTDAGQQEQLTAAFANKQVSFCNVELFFFGKEKYKMLELRCYCLQKSIRSDLKN